MGDTGQMGRFINILTLFLALTLVATSCGDDAGSTDPGGDTPSASGYGESDDDDGSGSGDGRSGTGNSDLESVWPLPPGDATAIFPYVVIDTDFSTSENSGFSMTGIAVETVVAFYIDYFAQMGYDTDEIAAGDSTVLNVSDPNDPNKLGVVQADANSDETVTVNQQLDTLKP